MGSEETSARGRQRRRAAARKAERMATLETTLRDVWIWHAEDGVDLDALREILLKADRDAQIHAALDRIIVNA